MEVEETQETVHPPVVEDTAPKVRSDSVHLVGVDEMHTRDVEKYMLQHYNRPFQIEWIDDSSLNIVYDDPEDAFQALVAMTLPEEFEGAAPIAPEQLRRLKSDAARPEFVLNGRFALESDKKVGGARVRSRYYLMHGEPSRKEDLKRFGTKRSMPLKYGTKNEELLGQSMREDRVGDLFPEKAQVGPKIDVDDDLMADLLPHKAGKKPRRRNRNRNRGLPDLFSDKILVGSMGPKKAVDSNKDSVYRNMDY